MRNYILNNNKYYIIKIVFYITIEIRDNIFIHNTAVDNYGLYQDLPNVL